MRDGAGLGRARRGCRPLACARHSAKRVSSSSTSGRQTSRKPDEQSSEVADDALPISRFTRGSLDNCGKDEPMRGPVSWSSRCGTWGWWAAAHCRANAVGVSSPWMELGRLACRPVGARRWHLVEQPPRVGRVTDKFRFRLHCRHAATLIASLRRLANADLFKREPM